MGRAGASSSPARSSSGRAVGAVTTARRRSAAATAVSPTTGAVTTAATSTTSTSSTAGTPSTTVAPTTTAPPPPTLEQLLARGRVNIAHAGGELEGPDETIFTFRQALANGADVLEMNVHLSADGQVVLHHDATVDAKTNGTGPVVGKTAAELNALDAAYWWVPDVGVVHDRPEADYLLPRRAHRGEASAAARVAGRLRRADAATGRRRLP